jgi:hypothetical protein
MYGKGGVSIMWHRRYNNLISKVEIDSDCIIGIQLEIGSSLFVYFFKFICHVVTIL